MFNFFNRKKVTEKLFEQNLELAVKNKTLSLLENLYQTSVLTLLPEEMAQKITDIIRADLHLELAGVLVFKKEADSLVPLAFSKSERLLKTLNNLGFLLADISITDISNREFLKKVVYGKENNTTNNPQEVWQELINKEYIKEIKKQSHIKTILLYPLIKGDGVLGVLLLGFNRDYNTLNAFEKASIKSFINVIALLLDKAYLYKDLQDSYEVTKRAYALEKRAKEELEKLDKIKNQFVQQTQHDLRTPLTSIMGYSDLLINGTFGKQKKETIEVIKKIQAVAQNMIRKVNNFLDVTQFQLGKNPVSLKPGIPLVPILDEMVKELNFVAEKKEVVLQFKKPKKPFNIAADREKLKTALFNVIDNSIKYSPKGKVTITVEDRNAVKIIIADTGIGMTEEQLKTLFNRQFERDEKAKETASGKGIGLYLATQIIIAHKGNIWAESAGPGKGTTFYVELPLG